MSTEKLLFKMRGIISCLSTNGNHPIEEKKLKKKAGFNARAKVLHSQLALVVKNLPADTYRHKRHRLGPWVWKIPRRRARQSTSVFLSGESHGQRSLVGYSPWGLKSQTHLSD